MLTLSNIVKVFNNEKAFYVNMKQNNECLLQLYDVKRRDSAHIPHTNGRETLYG